MQPEIGETGEPLRSLQPTDTQLLDRAADGDHLAFSHLLTRHDPAMRRLAGRLLSNQTSMDDALQDAYLKAFRGLAEFDGRSAFSTWLYTITYRTCLDHIRSKDRRREVNLDHVEAMASTTTEVSDRLATQDLLSRALLSIPPDQRAVVLLVDGEGLDYADTAVVLGVSKGTVASRLSRARTALRSHIEHETKGATS